MRKLLMILIGLIITYILLGYSIKHFGNGHDISYKINDFNVKEILSINQKDEIDNYYLKIKDKNIEFDFQIFEDFNKDKKILNSIKLKKIDNLLCVLPIFKGNQIITDIMCKDKDTIYSYTSIKGTNNEIDNFANQMREYGYDFKKYENNLKQQVKSKTVTLFTDNIIDNHYIVINDYRGLKAINLSNNIEEVKLFSKDIYDVSLAQGIKDKYIIFNYDDKYHFSKIFILDVVKNKIKEKNLSLKISHNSKIIGISGNNVYLIDYDNKKEYEINLKNRHIREVGNKEEGYITYNCNKQENIDSKTILNKEYTFPVCNRINKDKNYYRIDKVGGKNSGYYYYYKKTNDGYKIYRSNAQNENEKFYITTVKNLDNIEYHKEYIYYIKDNQINYYSDNTGIRTLLENTEFEFNKSLNYHLYVKES